MKHLEISLLKLIDSRIGVDNFARQKLEEAGFDTNRAIHRRSDNKRMVELFEQKEPNDE